MEKGSHLEGEEILHDGVPGEQRDSNTSIGPSFVWRYNLNDNNTKLFKTNPTKISFVTLIYL